MGFRGQKAQPVEAMANRLNRLRNRSTGLIGAKTCALMTHIRYDLCTKGHSNHPT